MKAKVLNEGYDLVMFKNSKVVAKQSIDGWTMKEVGEQILYQEKYQGRTCKPIKRKEVRR